MSGKTIQRLALEQILDYGRDGYVVLVHSMDRLARNLDDLRNIVKQPQNKLKFALLKSLWNLMVMIHQYLPYSFQ